jgi:hypothetical protein
MITQAGVHTHTAHARAFHISDLDLFSTPLPGTFTHLTTLEEAGIILGKHSDTKIKPLPLPLTNGHGRYITVTPEWALLSVGRWGMAVTYYNRYELFVTVSLM